jgi:hypothetical protein
MPILLLTAIFAGGAEAAEDDIGQIKTLSGGVVLIRDGSGDWAKIGDRVRQKDVVSTGQEGTVGITFIDGSSVSLGPDSVLSLDRFRFDATTHEGVFDTSLKRGTLAVRSGQIVKERPEAMTVRTPTAILGVRGTDFVVRSATGQ